MKHPQEPRLALAADYAYEALCGVPDDEGPYQALWRHACTRIHIAEKVSSVVGTMDPIKPLDAIPDLMNLLALIKTLVETTQGLYASQDANSVLEGMSNLSKRRADMKLFGTQTC